MERILLVARNVFRAILHGKIVYLWIAGVLLLTLRSAGMILVNFGNPAIQAMMQKRAVSGALDTWSTLCIALAIFMGASAVGSEITRKTIVTVLARPMRRWEFLLGKWIGVQAFGLLSLAIGLLVSFALASYLGAEFESKPLGIALAQTAAAIVLYSGLAIAIGTVMTPGIAGALTILVVFLPGFVTFLVDSDDAVYHNTGVVLDYVVPPGYTSHYAATIPAPIPADAFRRGGFGGGGGGGFGRGNRRGDIPPIPQPGADNEPEINYSTDTNAVLQNVGYALVFFAIGALVFLRRDLRLS